MVEEIWRTAVYDGEPYENYQVSNLGRILSLNYKHTGRAELMNPWEDKDGYLKVELWKNKISKTCFVHRLVAQTFLPNPDNLPFINHKIEGDEGKTINFVFFNEDGTVDEKRSTIEWCTYEYNNNYGTRNERSAKAQINGKLSKKVLQLSLTGELIREWESTRECDRNGFDHSAVGKCCNGKLPHYKGFKWQYE